MADYDGVWKEALEQFFELVLALLFPELYAEIDWSVECEALDTEARRLFSDAVVGKRIADALVKASTPEREDNGRDVRYVHVEVQCQVDDNFPHRLDDYNNVFKVRHGHPIITVAILGDDNPTWEPRQYVFACGGFRKEVTYPLAKLLKYRGQEAQLEAEANPIALLVLAHLLMLATRIGDDDRRDGKVRLLKNLLDRKMDLEAGRQLARLIDWMVELPDQAQRQVWQELRQRATEDRMPFLSYPEQIGFDKGYDKGKEEGKRSGLLRGIEIALEVKFGAEGLALLPALQQQTDLALLETFAQSIKTTSNLDDLRRLLPSS